MDEFRKELTLKREARHSAIAAVSSEMERLRRELDAEREAHSGTSSMLAQLRSAHSNPQDLDLASGGFAKATMKEQERKNTDESEKALKRAEAQHFSYTHRYCCEQYNQHDVRLFHCTPPCIYYATLVNKECAIQQSLDRGPV